MLGILRVPRMEGEGEGEVSLVSSHLISLSQSHLTNTNETAYLFFTIQGEKKGENNAVTGLISLSYKYVEECGKFLDPSGPCAVVPPRQSYSQPFTPSLTRNAITRLTSHIGTVKRLGGSVERIVR